MSGRLKITEQAKALQEEFLRTIRIEAAKEGIRQNEIAARAGISPAYMSEIVNHKRHLSLNVAIKLANAFNLDIELNFTLKE